MSPNLIASLALATVTAALGVAAWLEGRQWQSREATFGSAPDPRMVARYQQYRAAQSPGHTDLMISPEARAAEKHVQAWDKFEADAADPDVLAAFERRTGKPYEPATQSILRPCGSAK